MTTKFVIQLLASALTIAGQFQYGNKRLWGPVLGMAAQVPWWLIMVLYDLWGLLPVNAAMLAIHIRNFIKWRREAA